METLLHKSFFILHWNLTSKIHWHQTLCALLKRETLYLEQYYVGL